MGFINDNITESAHQINDIKAQTQTYIDSIRFNLSVLNTQRQAMIDNDEYSEEDFNELLELINDLKQQLNNI